MRKREQQIITLYYERELTMKQIGDRNRRRSWQDDSRYELGGPLIGATNEKPRLRKQQGFSSLHLQELILPNPAVLERAAGDDI